MTQIHSDEYVLAYKDDEATKQALFDKVIGFLREHECFSGESYAQADAPQIGAMDLMVEIIDDVLEVKATWK
jgi:hypothetical protein